MLSVKIIPNNNCKFCLKYDYEIKRNKIKFNKECTLYIVFDNDCCRDFTIEKGTYDINETAFSYKISYIGLKDVLITIPFKELLKTIKKQKK